MKTVRTNSEESKILSDPQNDEDSSMMPQVYEVLRLRQNINIFYNTFIFIQTCFAAFRH